MEPFVITIGRELGSGGKAIAEIIGKKLNVPVYDRRLILMAAQESGLAPDAFKKADEVPSRGFMSQIIRSLSAPFASYNNLYSNSLSNESLFTIQADIIRQKADKESCIIVGRCSDYILRNHPRHLSIFIRAEYADRLRFIMDRNHLSREEAKNAIENTDALRSDYHNFYSETNWGDSRAYDLCINSSILGIEGTAEVLIPFISKALHI